MMQLIAYIVDYHYTPKSTDAHINRSLTLQPQLVVDTCWHPICTVLIWALLANTCLASCQQTSTNSQTNKVRKNPTHSPALTRCPEIVDAFWFLGLKRIAYSWHAPQPRSRRSATLHHIAVSSSGKTKPTSTTVTQMRCGGPPFLQAGDDRQVHFTQGHSH